MLARFNSPSTELDQPRGLVRHLGSTFQCQEMLHHVHRYGKDPYLYQLNGHVLSYVKTSPYLGVLVSEDLSFSPHISKVSQRASSNLGFISRNLKGCPERLKELAYIALVRPSLEYTSSVWDPHTRLDIDKLEKIQCCAALFIKGYSRYRRRDTDIITSRDLINVLK